MNAETTVREFLSLFHTRNLDVQALRGSQRGEGFRSWICAHHSVSSQQ